MARYAIGDIQGCFDSLRALLDTFEFDPSEDQLWLTGDLVNRGPKSLEVLRWAESLGDRVIAVLGNHDLHLLARAAGKAAPKKLDTLDEVLAAPDRDRLLDWLKERPLLYRDRDFVLVHAGLHPTWRLEEAEALAREAEPYLRGDSGGEFAETYRRSGAFSASLRGVERAAAAASVMTRIRTCREDGSPCLFSGPPEEAPAGCRPWYERRPGRGEACVVFGHWSALGIHVTPDAIGLDTGCVWGGELTAIRLEDRAVFSQPAID